MRLLNHYSKKVKVTHALPFLALFSIAVLASDWEEKFKTVCEYDRFCTRLRSSDGSWLKPKPEIVAILKDAELQTQVAKVSSQYGIHPTALAGAILAENSLNVGLKDSVQTWLASKMGITKVGAKSFSFGFGQISLPAALEAERHLAKLEKRSEKSQQELIAEVADPVGSIRVAATILRKVQDDYKEQGFDISKDPALLATLYNLGRSEERSKAAKAEGRIPKINYFGLFVQKFEGEIAKTVRPIAKKSESPTVTSAVSGAKPEPAPAVKVEHAAFPLGGAPAGLSIAKNATVQSSPRTLTEVTTDSTPLVSFPTDCESTVYGQDPMRDAKSIQHGAPVGILNRGSVVREVSRALDCRSNAWRLVAGSKGELGWIEADRLERLLQKKLVTVPSCPREVSNKCIDGIKRDLGESFIGFDAANGELSFRPVSAPGVSSGFENEDARCAFAAPTPQSVGATARYRSSYYSGSNRPLPPAELIEEASRVKASVERELARMSKALDIPLEELDSAANPYSLIYAILNAGRTAAVSCMRSATSEYLNCEDPRRYGQSLFDLMKGVQYQKVPNVQDVSGLYAKMIGVLGSSGYYSKAFYDASDDELKEADPEVLRESFLNCERRLSELKETAPKAVKTAPAPQSGFGGYVSQPMLNASQPGFASGMMGMGGGMGGMGGGFGMPVSVDRVFEAVRKATPEHIEKYKSELISAARFCHARMNLLSKSNSQNPFDCTVSPASLQYGVGQFSKEVVAAAYRAEPGALAVDIEIKLSTTLSSGILADILGDAKVPSQPHMQGMQAAPSNSYCPNRTAEKVEELFERHSCIDRAFVPTKLLAKRLYAQKDRVVFRQYESNDRIVLTLGKNRCGSEVKQ